MQKKKQFFILENDKIKLVPYLKEYVFKYNKWMQDDKLLFETSSERLTLEEELENQESWCMDEKKYTFIILEKNREEDDENVKSLKINNNCMMCGDINVFFSDQLEKHEAELTIMIAEESSRHKGIASQAIDIMMHFINSLYHKHTFIVKISTNNLPSLSLFRKLNFTLIKEVPFFQELHFQLSIKDLPSPSYSQTLIQIPYNQS